MRLVSMFGGHSIGVYNDETQDKTKVYKMMKDNRIKYFAPTDYSEDSKLEQIVKAIINRTVDNEILETMHYDYKKECLDFYNKNNDAVLERKEWIFELVDSRNFASTHMAIKGLQHYTDQFSEEEINDLIWIATHNSQVKYILGDMDVKAFYKAIISRLTDKGADVEYILEIMNN